MTVLSDKVGKNIKSIREVKQLSQKHVADELDMTVSGYSKIERGEVNLTLNRLEKIAEIFQVRVSEVLSFDESVVFNNYGHNEVQSFNNYQVKNNERLFDLLSREVEHLKTEIQFLRNTIGQLSENQ